MIAGIGVDLVDVRRIQALLDRFPIRFPQRLFTEAERLYAQTQFSPATAYAKRFAAKEALIKAMGQAFPAPLSWKDVAVSHEPLGRPCFVFSPKAWAFLKQLHGPFVEVHLSLTDEPPYAQAFVILSRKT